MVATYDPNLRITEQGTGDNQNTWGTVLNTQALALLCTSISGVIQIDFSAGTSIDISQATLIAPNNYPGVANGLVDTARYAVLELTSVSSPLTTTLTLTLPALQKVYFIRAAQTGGYPITVKCSGGTQSLTFNSGQASVVYTNGTSIYENASLTNLKVANNLSDLSSVSTARTNLGLGTAALLNVGTGPNQVVQLNGSSQLPALDGSLLINVTGTPAGIGTAAYLNAGTSAGNVVQLNGSAQLPAVNGSLLTNLNVPGVPTVTTGNPWKIVMGAITKQGGYQSAASGTITYATAFSGTPYTAHIQAPIAVSIGVSTLTASNMTLTAISTDEQGGQFTPSAYYWEVTGPT